MIPLHGPYTACAYICTEDVFPHRRLMQLAEAFAEEHKSLGLSAKTYTDNVMLAHSATVVSVWLAALFCVNGEGLLHQCKNVMVFACASLYITLYVMHTYLRLVLLDDSSNSRLRMKPVSQGELHFHCGGGDVPYNL